MKKYFVPYEIAKQLKEIGFDESCFGRYEAEKLSTYPLTCYSSTVECINAPLYDQVIEWFIDKHSISINPFILAQKWTSEVLDISKKGWIRKDETIRNSPRTIWWDDQNEWTSRSEALNAGIQKAIQLVKEKL